MAGAERQALQEAPKLRRRNATFVQTLFDAAEHTLQESPFQALSRAHHQAHAKAIPLRKDKEAWRFLSMVGLTFLFMIVELVVGSLIGSLALQADAYHMLSDVGALLVGAFALRATRRASTERATFGFARSEVVGALVNGVFLIAVCFSIVMDSLERFANAEENVKSLEKDVDLLLIVAGVGLGINIIGLFIFSCGGGGGHGHSHGGHGHSHGGHGHSHGGHGHSHGSKRAAPTAAAEEEGSEEDAHTSEDEEEGEGAASAAATPPNEAAEGEAAPAPKHGSRKPKRKAKRKMSMNTKGVLLHVLGDALGSIGVIISGCIIKFTDWPIKPYIDPLTSIVLVLIICSSTIKLVKRSINILLQKVPGHIDVAALRKEVLALPGVLGVHDLHVWQLDDEKVVGSMHVMLEDGTVFEGVTDAIKVLLHRCGIHASTVQPEFVEAEVVARLRHVADRLNEAAAAASAGNSLRGSLDAGNVGTVTGTGAAATYSLQSVLAGIDTCNEVVCEADSCVAASCCPAPAPAPPHLVAAPAPVAAVAVAVAVPPPVVPARAPSPPAVSQ